MPLKISVWLCFVYLVLFCMIFPVAAENQTSSIVVAYEQTDKLLKNPAMGLLLPTWMNAEIKSDDLPAFSVAYTRWTWKTLEPKRGDYRFERLKKWIEKNKSLGLRSAFRIMSTIIGDSATPEYLFESGVPAAVHRNGTQKDPVYWHPKYLELYDTFVQAMGRYFRGGRDIEFLDLGGIGVWGEMQFGFHRKDNDMWTKEQFEQYGYTEEILFSAYRRMIDSYRKAFPKTTLIVNISSKDQINNYLGEHGIGMRWDGLEPDHKRAMQQLTSIFRQYGLNNPYGKNVQCVYEFRNSFKKLEKVRSALQWVSAAPVSYLNVNLGSYSSVDPDIKQEITKIAKEIGYRFVLQRAVLPKETLFLEDESAVLKTRQIWKNVGLAPSQKDFQFTYTLIDKVGEPVLEGTEELAPNTSEWQPSTLVCCTEVPINIAPTIPDGEYELRFALKDPDVAEKTIALGIVGRDAKGMYPMARVHISTEPNTTKRVIVVSPPSFSE